MTDKSLTSNTVWTKLYCDQQHYHSDIERNRIQNTRSRFSNEIISIQKFMGNKGVEILFLVVDPCVTAINFTIILLCSRKSTSNCLSLALMVIIVRDNDLEKSKISLISNYAFVYLPLWST